LLRRPDSSDSSGVFKSVDHRENGGQAAAVFILGPLAARFGELPAGDDSS
jgi:hypothetical protein